MSTFSRKEINKAVGVLAAALNEKAISQNVYLILIGAASLIVKYNLKRATSDIDIMETGLPVNRLGGLGALLSQLGFHVVSDTIVHLHPDYLERLEPVTQNDNIHVLSLGPYDLAISKIARGLARDIEDVVSSSVLKNLNLEELERLYLEAVSYWIGNPEHFSLNWKLFEDAFKKRQT